MKQLTIFGDVEQPVKKRRNGGSQNPIVFRDYESFIAKFSDHPRTTDECWTPQDVYEAVVDYVGTLVDMTDRLVLRPFYPGGDYINAEYPMGGGVVIDNPPFSIFSKIVRFYCENDIPFFLFGPGLTIMQCAELCTSVHVSTDITYSNGAKVRSNFVTNLTPDIVAMTAPSLDRAIAACPSQNVRVNLPSYVTPDNVLSTSNLNSICHGGIDFKVRRSECVVIRNLDRHPKQLFGKHLLLSDSAAGLAAAKLAAAKLAAAKNEHVIELSARERRIIDRLNAAVDNERDNNGN